MKLLRDKQVAKKLGCHWSYVWKLARRPDFPRAIKLGLRHTAWSDEEIDAWLEHQRKETKDETTGSTG